jgi:hypothetical protein
MSTAQSTTIPSATADSIQKVRHNAPRELLVKPIWVAWDCSPRADGRAKKTPLNPRTGGNAMANNPETWGTFEQAAECALRLDNAGGVGFMLTNGPWIGIDFDHVIDTETGELCEGAADLVRELTPSYIERSPSGDGLHVLLRGDVPDDWASKAKDAFGPGKELEIYADGRYFTATGDRWSEASEIADATDNDVEVLATFMEKKAQTKAAPGPRFERSSVANDDRDRARFGLLELGLLDDQVDDRDAWLNVLVGLKALDAQALAIAWSRRSDKFVEGDIEKMWPGINGTSPGKLFGKFKDANPGWSAAYKALHQQAQDNAQDFDESADDDGTVFEFIRPRRAAQTPWPEPLNDSVRIGLLADVLDAVEQETEADPAAIVFDFIARVGCLVGRGPHFSISHDRHGTNAFVLIVGSTGSGRKGTSAAYPRELARIADPALQTQSGMSSGEGLIETIKDERIVGINKDGSDKIEPGVTDKRVIVTEAEFARTLKASSRRDNTLSTLIRLAWDSRTLSTMTKQPYKATDPHVSIIGHITPEELRSLLSSNDISGGTANRFLFVASKKSRTLPYGGHVSDDVLDRLGTILRDLVDFGRRNGKMLFTEQALTEWAEHYATLARDEAIGGVAGQVLARGVPQVRRLAMIFAILDRSRDVDSHHVRAAMEAWRFSRDSVLHVFGVRSGNRLADLIHDELRLAEGEQLTRAEIRSIAGGNVTSAAIEDALATLHDAEIAYGQRRKTGQRGKPAQVWRLHGNVRAK